MPAITWNGTYSVGIRKIDRQHHRIIDILNELYDLDRSRERQQLQHIFTLLRDYVQEHFGDEELLMREAGYPGLEHHKQEHARFIDTICEYHRDYLKGRRLVLINVYNVIWDWLVSHVLTEDRKLGEFRAGRRLGTRAARVPPVPVAPTGDVT